MNSGNWKKTFPFAVIAAAFFSLLLVGISGKVNRPGCTDKNQKAPGAELHQLLAYANELNVITGRDRGVPLPYTNKLAAVQTNSNSSSDEKNGNCIDCHSNAGHLIKTVKPAEAPPEDGCATATTRPPFLNVFVKPDFTDSVHGQIGCTGCHAGDAEATTADAAHNGLTSGAHTCAGCHQDITERHSSSLHKTLNGMRHALELRTGEENFHAAEPAWQEDCASCHAECSDCHITQPAAIGGGLLKGHEFLSRPPMEETCAVCHGSRAGGEYLGHFEGIEADVHFKAGMHCLDCHTNDLHGDGQEYQNRWQVKDSPSCTDCHEAIPNQSVAAHDSRHEDLSCQVCHSQPYQNCFSCHATIEDGEYFRSVDHKDLDLKIGRNTVRGYDHGIVLLRNNPASRDTFEHFGDNLLPHHDDYPTWKTAAPHNIQRVTDQNRSCNNCHGNDEIFLKESDLDPNGSAANRKSLLPELP